MSLGIINFTFADDGGCSVQAIRSCRRIYPDAPVLIVEDAVAPLLQEHRHALEALGAVIISSTFERQGNNLNGYSCTVGILSLMRAMGADNVLKIDSDSIITADILKPMVAGGYLAQWCTGKWVNNERGFGFCYILHRTAIEQLYWYFAAGVVTAPQEDVAISLACKVLFPKKVQWLLFKNNNFRAFQYDKRRRKAAREYAKENSLRAARITFGSREQMPETWTNKRKRTTCAKRMNEFMNALEKLNAR